MLSKKSLGRDVDCIIVSFCGARSLCKLGSLKKPNELDKDDDILEPVWKCLIEKRWRARGNILRALGASSWKVAYQIMSVRHKIPRGVYTEKHNTIFGSTNSSGCEAWITIGHRSNASLRINGAPYNTTNNFIELRVCIQNVHNGLISVPLDTKNFAMICRTEENQSLQKMCITNVCVVGLNGLRKETSDEDNFDVRLGPLESAVIAVQVSCPQDMEFETDFLARADSFGIKMNACKPCFPHNPIKEVVLKAKFVDEDTVWESYLELPGRVILLRLDCGGDSNMI
jgi:hypothetical protein